ncbi:MAG TPA: nucleoside-diphosphate sugar epimerase/dehydratase [Phnomibacter sp.]|nr:nucleoside-diphosphate sugar epimerase/dehydratase [Phnomibacter sp.]
MYKVRNYLLSHQVAPKWMVFLFDSIIGAVSVVIAYYLRFNLDYTAVFNSRIFDDLILVIITNGLFFFIFRTYKGIIRFSGFAEAIRTCTALFASFILLGIVNVGLELFGKQALIPASILIINLLTGSCLIVGYRLLVKTSYRASLRMGQRMNVLIFGGEIYGSQLKATIEQSSNQQYSVIAFIDDDPTYIGKTIDNIKIFSFEQVKPMAKELEIGMILFAKPELDAAVKNEVVDFCLEHDIQVRNIPPIDLWIKGQLYISQLKEIKIEELLGRPQINLRNQHVIDLFASRRVLITGAAGSIGSELARQVAGINPSIIILCDQNETGLYELEYELRNNYPACDSIAVFIGDVRDESAMESLFKRFRPDIVFHAAAYKHVPLMEYHPSEAVRNNVLGTKILADLAIEYEVDRFLLVSTDKAINPTNVMGASKRIAEIYTQSLGNRDKKVVHLNNVSNSDGNFVASKASTKFITTRFGNVLGSSGSVIPRFKEQIANGGPITVTHPDIIRYFMTIPEACSLLLEAVTMGKGGEIFLFDMGEPVKIIDLARKMIKLAGYVPGKDIEIKFTGLRPGEKLYEELLNNKEEVLATHHKKILIARVAEYDFYAVNKALDLLLKEAYENGDENVVRAMKKMVPEYISNNSIYQSFDQMNQQQDSVVK